MVSAVRGGGVDVEELLSRAENAQRRAGEAQLRQQQSEARQQAQQGANGAQGGAQGANVGGAGGASGACGPSVAVNGGGSGGASSVQQPVRPQVTPETQRGAREAARGREGPSMQDVQRRAVDERAPVTAKPEASEPNATSGQRPPGEGLERQWKQFRDVDPDKLRAALPDRAKHLAQSFIDAGKKHNVDPVLLAAISRHETGNWTSAAFKRGNAMGISGSGGPRSFARPEDSVNQMARQLADPNGYYKNATTLKDLWKIYAPSPVVGSRATNDPGGLNRHWGKNVDRYMSELEQRLG